jgi:hypothetical protein
MKGTEILGSKKEQDRQATWPSQKKNCIGEETAPEDFSKTTVEINMQENKIGIQYT